MTAPDPRYPIGRLDRRSKLDPARRAELISEMDALPDLLREAVADLRPHEWDLPYRDGGWTVRQVVHHLADSHLNAYVRFRLALTEDVPAIKPYDEARWAELPDVGLSSPDVSIAMVTALHRRLVDLLRALPDEAFARPVYHPEQGREVTVDELVTIYSWHGRHHVAHIRQALARSQDPGFGIQGNPAAAS